MNEVINEKTLHTIVHALFWSKSQDSTEVPDSTSAEIANLFIYRGFEYLRLMNQRTDDLTDIQDRIINDALQVSGQLTKVIVRSTNTNIGQRKVKE